MQALEKITNDNYWFTIVLVCLLLSVFFLKAIDAKKLKANAFALFLRGVLEKEKEDAVTIVTPFKTIVFLFSTLVLSCVFYKLIFLKDVNLDKSISTFFTVFISVLSYFVIKRILEYLLSAVFQIKNTLKFFFVSKSSYLYSVCFLLFIALVVEEYAPLNAFWLGCFSLFLFLIRFILHVINNKKLILNKLFYFFLYLCAFEIAPLFILFKLMF